jgi:hypothetical protein
MIATGFFFFTIRHDEQVLLVAKNVSVIFVVGLLWRHYNTTREKKKRREDSTLSLLVKHMMIEWKGKRASLTVDRRYHQLLMENSHDQHYDGRNETLVPMTYTIGINKILHYHHY